MNRDRYRYIGVDTDTDRDRYGHRDKYCDRFLDIEEQTYTCEDAHVHMCVYTYTHTNTFMCTYIGRKSEHLGGQRRISVWRNHCVTPSSYSQPWAWRGVVLVVSQSKCLRAVEIIGWLWTISQLANDQLKY